MHSTSAQKLRPTSATGNGEGHRTRPLGSLAVLDSFLSVLRGVVHPCGIMHQRQRKQRFRQKAGAGKLDSHGTIECAR